MSNARNAARRNSKSSKPFAQARVKRPNMDVNFAASIITCGKKWQDKFYAIKQVAPVVKEEANEIVVITVYTFYF